MHQEVDTATFHGIYTIYDSKVEAFLQPWSSPDDILATRSFQAALTTDKGFALFAADYTLFRVGSFDPHTGIIHPAEAFRNLGNGEALSSQR